MGVSTGERPLPRRSVLTGALAVAGLGALTACGRTPLTADDAPRPGASEGSPSPGSTPGAASPSPSSSSPPSQGERPARADIVQRYSGRRPRAFGLSTAGIVTRLPAAAGAVALTFDACGGRPGSRGCGYDAALIQVLRSHDVRATLFLSSTWIAANPGPARELADDPRFEIAAHGLRHRPLSVAGASAYGIAGTRDPGEVWDEIERNVEDIAALTGAAPRHFRAGTAHVDDVAVDIAHDLRCAIVNFSVDGDSGATLPRPEVAARVARAAAGDVVISQMNRPGGGDARGYADALPRLLDRGVRTATLSEAGVLA